MQRILYQHIFILTIYREAENILTSAEDVAIAVLNRKRYYWQDTLILGGVIWLLKITISYFISPEKAGWILSATLQTW